MTSNSDLAALVRTIHDHPRPGIAFRDISTLMLDGDAFAETVRRMAALHDGMVPDRIAAIEARGFVFGSALAHRFSCGLVMLRKPGKLPGAASGIDYALEYGTDRLEMHDGAVEPGMKVTLVDDLVATGGTALAALALLRGAGAEVTHASFVIDLPDLGGSAALREAGVEPRALIEFGGA